MSGARNKSYDDLLNLIHRSSPLLPSNHNMADKAVRRTRFEQVYAKVADELVQEIRKEGIPEEVLAWYRKVFLMFHQRWTFTDVIRISNITSPVANSTVACLW